MNVHGDLGTNALLATLGGNYDICADYIDRLLQHFEIAADRNICSVPAKLLTEEGLSYIKPELSLQSCLRKYPTHDSKRALHLVLKNDIAVVMTALGQYENYGVLSQRLQEMALLSLNRLKDTIKKLGCDVNSGLLEAIEYTLKYEEQIMRNNFLLQFGVATYSIIEDISDVMVPWLEARSNGGYSVLILWDESMYDEFQRFVYKPDTKSINVEQLLNNVYQTTCAGLKKDIKHDEISDSQGIHALMCFPHARAPKQIILKIQKTNNPVNLLKLLPVPVGRDRFTIAEQIEIFELWFKRYGATPAAISAESLEFTVETPPKSFEDAISLAKQHYAYYPKIKNRFAGKDCISELAALLMKSTVWRFAEE